MIGFMEVVRSGFCVCDVLVGVFAHGHGQTVIVGLVLLHVSLGGWFLLDLIWGQPVGNQRFSFLRFPPDPTDELDISPPPFLDDYRPGCTGCCTSQP